MTNFVCFLLFQRFLSSEKRCLNASAGEITFFMPQQQLTQIVTINSKFADDNFYIFESRFFLISMYFQRRRSLT